MDKRLLEEMIKVIDRHFHVQELNHLLKACMDDKIQSKSIWGEITLTVHEMLEGSSPYIDKLAAYIELLMLASDMMDDLADQDNTSRPWMNISTPIALNAAAALLIAVTGECAELREQHPHLPLPANGDIHRMLTRAANGQHQDIRGQAIHSEEDYLALVLQKSAPLMQLAFYMGYSSVESCEDTTKLQLDQMAEYVAIAAQLHNDLHDLIQFDVKGDLFDKKRTFPILYLLDQCSEQHPVFYEYYEGKLSLERLKEMKEACLQAIVQSGCIEYTRVVQGLYVHEAEKIVEAIPGQPEGKRQFLQKVIAPYRKF
ncbi:polyprenyl synthetase family protein [Paenibacillus athensensis]|uniref:Polyprenyl synthetase n=1 Tax=Paenibacillus athensensis TaxID=1967502 RepID=A0A4Y8PQ56_9BACL|nr:class 1 isoprenoid biosynthesis enzyme [Paenibacillus athensensis]MCD1261689.1 polyprenyl synthetase family protein [Paenibacillus athensensis]